MKPRYTTVGIVGAGAMGQGIGQIAAQAGSLVRLFDVHADATGKADNALAAPWDKRVDKARLARLRSAATLEDLADCALVIEAVVERLDVKKSLFFHWRVLFRRKPYCPAIPRHCPSRQLAPG